MELYPHQLAGRDALLQAPKQRYILGWEMGCGKTPATIAALRAQPGRTLIVTPAIGRLNWLAELQQWWPSCPIIGVINKGRNASNLTRAQEDVREAAYVAPIQIVSYELLHNCTLEGWHWIVFDELHRLQNPMSKVSKAARQLTRRNPDAAIVGLTATLIANQITNLWHQLDLLWPGRFGKPDKNSRGCWDFNIRYANCSHNGYGYKFEGLRQKYAAELQHRLAAVSSRVTRNDIAHLIPSFDMAPFYADASDQKTDIAIEWTKLVQENATHICLLTHFRETAHYLAKKLKGICITGDIPVEARHKLLEQARQQPSAIICATMHSVNEAIDLTFLTQTLFVELSYRPKDIIQAMGRFSRLSGRLPSSVKILVRCGTADEVIAQKVLAKIEVINQMIRAGGTEEALEATLGDQRDDEDFSQSLRSAAESADWDMSEYGL